MKRNIFFSCILLFICALLLIGCDSPSGSGGGGGSGKSRSQKYAQKDSYGQSTLPDLNNASSLAGQCYVSDGNTDAIFFNEDGTCYVRSRAGTWATFNDELLYSLAQLVNNHHSSYQYNPATKKLKLERKGLFSGNTIYTSAENYVNNELTLLKQQAKAAGISNIRISKDYINAFTSLATAILKHSAIELSLTDSNGCLEIEEIEKYKCDEGDVEIKLYPANRDFSLEVGDYKFSKPILCSFENGQFSGYDFERTSNGTTIEIRKTGSFSGKYRTSGENYYITFTSMSSSFPDELRQILNTEYRLLPDPFSHTFKPILKTINYTVIDSDNAVAAENCQIFISDPDTTEWTESTFTMIYGQYLDGIYTNRNCTTSVMGSQVKDGQYVYVKMKNITADYYFAEFGSVKDGAPEATVTITND